jgi:hypothetical protein
MTGVSASAEISIQTDQEEINMEHKMSFNPYALRNSSIQEQKPSEGDDGASPTPITMLVSRASR